jgi:large subunit ribosomal protein L3
MKRKKKNTQPDLSPFYRFVKEFRPALNQTLENYKEGDVMNAGMFTTDDLVSISGKSKGRGFTGVMKRHHFKGFQQSHGSHESFRGPGSIGQCAQPSRVFKGVKMAGHHGNTQVTVRNVEIIKIEAEQNLIMVKGSIPGHRNTLLVIKKEF